MTSSMLLKSGTNPSIKRAGHGTVRGGESANETVCGVPIHVASLKARRQEVFNETDETRATPRGDHLDGFTHVLVVIEVLRGLFALSDERLIVGGGLLWPVAVFGAEQPRGGCRTVLLGAGTVLFGAGIVDRASKSLPLLESPRRSPPNPLRESERWKLPRSSPSVRAARRSPQSHHHLFDYQNGTDCQTT